MALKVRITTPLEKKTRAQDPDLTKASDGVNQPEVAPVTFGPNRYTIRVPSLATKLSLGQGDATDAVRFNKRAGVGTESGIVAQTDTHAHVHTFGTALPEAKTIIRLGIPTTSVPCEGPEYEPDAETGIGALIPDAFTVWNGYSMVTQGASYQESRNNHLVVSAEGEVRVVAKTFVNVATSGDVLILADAEGQPEELVQNQGDAADPIAFGMNDVTFRQGDLKELGMRTASFVEACVEFLQMVREMATLQFNPMPGMNEWLPPDFLDVLSAVASAADVLVEAKEVVECLSEPSEPGGNVGIHASKNFTAGAEEKVTVMSGGKGSFNAAQSVALNGGISAAVHGNVSASMGGMFTEISGLVSTSVEALFRGVTIKGGAGVNVLSVEAPICVTSGPSVQINAVEGCAWMAGGLEAFVGAGEGPGTGLYSMGEAFMFLGSFGAVPSMIMPVPIPAAGITFTPEFMMHEMTPTTMILAPEGLEIAAPEVAIEAATTTIVGMVYLG